MKARTWAALVPLGLLLLAMSAPPLGRWHGGYLGWALTVFFSEVCHQDPARCFRIGAATLPLCIRCFGIYAGAAVGLLLPASRGTAIRALLIALLLNGIDVAAEFTGLHGDLPALRLTLGLALGGALGAIVAAHFAGECKTPSRKPVCVSA